MRKQEKEPETKEKYKKIQIVEAIEEEFRFTNNEKWPPIVASINQEPTTHNEI